MRRRTGYILALAGSLVLAVMLAIAWQPGFAGGAAAGMSAPAPPARSIEAAPAAKLLQSQFDWHGHALLPAGLSLAVAAVRSSNGIPPQTKAVPQHYGPLHRRPPPSFS